MPFTRSPLFLACILLLCFLVDESLAFSASAKPSSSIFDSISSFFGGNNQSSLQNENEAKRQELKSKLLQVCKADPVARDEVESIIDELKSLQLFQETASSPLLQKEWLLVWTTEKEINFFSDFNISGDISQTITSDGVLTNMIPFRKGGSFGVVGKVEADENIPQRTNFVFESAKIDLGKFQFTLPPVGQGWFDTLYLDEELRVDLNSRNDILICTPF